MHVRVDKVKKQGPEEAQVRYIRAWVPVELLPSLLPYNLRGVDGEETGTIPRTSK